MAKIYKRPNSLFWWVTSGTPPNRVRKPTTFKIEEYRKSEVQKIIDRAGINKFMAALGEPVKSVKLSVLYDSYKKEVDIRYSHVPGDAKNIKKIANRFMEKMGKNKIVSDISPFDIETFLLFRLKKVAISTVKKDKAFIGRMFDVAKSQEWIAVNPVRKVRKNLLPKETPRNRKINRRPLPLPLIKKAIKKSKNDRDIRFWWTMLLTGADAGDSASIKDAQIDKDNKTITFIRGKNGEETETIPLHPKLLSFDLVNIIPDITNWKIRQSRERFQVLMKEVGYDGRVDFKSLRHTFNHLLSRNGLGENDRSKLLGHQSMKTNQSYTHKDVERLRNAIDKIA